MRYRPLFQGPAEAPADFVPANPMERPWPARTRDHGSSDESAAGIQEAYSVRTDQVVQLTLRITEAERDAFDAFLSWWRRNPQPITFRFIHTDPSTEHTVRLVRPTISDGDVEYRPVQQFGGGYLVNLELRTDDGSRFTTHWRLRNTP